jgi:hypothetical protein
VAADVGNLSQIFDISFCRNLRTKLYLKQSCTIFIIAVSLSKFLTEKLLGSLEKFLILEIY